MLSEVEYGSYLDYSPRGASEVSRRSQRVRDAVKSWWPDFVRRQVIEQRLAGEYDEVGLEDFLGDDVTLIPAPRSSPLMKGALWPPKLICDELVRAGLGLDVVPALVRTEAVTRSHTAGIGGRPTPARHYETMVVDHQLVSGSRITVVDDFVTKGATLLAGASRVSDAYPGLEVRTFALVRTMGLVPDIDRIVNPARGRIWFDGYQAHREP